MAKPVNAPISRPDRLFGWVEKLLRHEGSALKPRIVVVTEHEARAWPLPAPCAPFGFESLIQAAAIAARTAGDDDLVGFLVKGAIHIRGGRRPGQTGQLDAMVVAASALERLGHLYIGEQDRSGWSLTRQTMEAAQIDRYAAFRGSDYDVDPNVERVLADHGWPGATISEVSARDILSPVGAAGESDGEAGADSSHGWVAPPPPSEPEGGAQDEAAEIVLHWSEARAHVAELSALYPVGWTALRRTPGVRFWPSSPSATPP